MKFRNGFVSNSSSQSFIAYIGEVKDLSKFEQYQKTIGESYSILSYDEICNEIKYCGDFYAHLYMPHDASKYSRYVFASDNVDVEEYEDGGCGEADDEDFDQRVIKLGACNEVDHGIKIIESANYTGRNG